ncbi:hypothetical protein Tcan_17235 [Toxocara canis]|uniref:Uncharacterized protein n=2 Tax=Toxocara canis TaxID=6265 RepID=A0A0B2W7A0_TOXCA|nr:hypothetical protein Tcan_17235 [Toxocara canis]VDM43027.1 unnamed protein product [Toxocara canis]
MIGLEDWFYNFTQFSRTGISPESLANVPRPFTELAIFGLFKGAELASVIGGCIVHPIYRFYLLSKLVPENTTNNSTKIIRNRCRRIQGRFLIGGIVLGPIAALAYAKYACWAEKEVKEKCYKIRCDKETMSLDRATLAFGFIGWYWKRFQGAVDGINIAIAYALFDNKVLKNYTYPLLVDKVKPEERLSSAEEGENTKTALRRFIAAKQKEFIEQQNKTELSNDRHS